MARHNREGEGTDQHDVRYEISYQPDWLRQIKISKTLSGGRQSTKTLFRNPATSAEHPPGDRVRTRVTSADGNVDLEITVSDPHRVEQIVITARAPDRRRGGEITLQIDGSLPLPGDFRKARGRRRRR